MVLILYILCEDSGAGKKFISDFIKCAGIPDHSVIILTSNGNLGLNHPYVRTHKQTVGHRANLRDEISKSIQTMI